MTTIVLGIIIGLLTVVLSIGILLVVLFFLFHRKKSLEAKRKREEEEEQILNEEDAMQMQSKAKVSPDAPEITVSEWQSKASTQQLPPRYGATANELATGEDMAHVNRWRSEGKPLSTKDSEVALDSVTLSISKHNLNLESLQQQPENETTDNAQKSEDAQMNPVGKQHMLPTSASTPHLLNPEEDISQNLSSPARDLVKAAAFHASEDTTCPEPEDRSNEKGSRGQTKGSSTEQTPRGKDTTKNHGVQTSARESSPRTGNDTRSK